MKKILLILAAVVLIACISSEDSGVQVIVGAKLIAAPGSQPIDYSVVVVKNGKFTSVGPEASTPVPKGAELLRGFGMTIESLPGGPAIAPGNHADLVLKGSSTQRVMRAGEWIR